MVAAKSESNGSTLSSTTPGIENSRPSLQAKGGYCSGGCADESANSNSETCESIKVSQHPVLCRTCGNETRVFECPGHPDDGVAFACGIMVENMEAGTGPFSCEYHEPKAAAPIIDSDMMNLELFASHNPRGALMRIRSEIRDLRQMFRNNPDRAEITCTLNRIAALTGGIS